MYQRIKFDNYTPELRELVDAGYPIFTNNWDTFIPEHKPELCKKIIDTYYFNCICCGEADRFRHYLNSQLERIMPYYNQLYASELLKVDPFLNHYLTTNNRSIDNLIKEANNDKSEVGKHIRDFAKSATGNSTTTGNLSTNYKETENASGTSNVSKDGTTKDTIGTDTSNKIDVTENVTGKQDVAGNGESTTTETGTVNRDGTKEYSDTPQKNLDGTIDGRYLTNYTETSDNETRNLTTKNTYTTEENTTREQDTTRGTTETGTEDTTKDGEYSETVEGKTTDEKTVTRTNGEDTTGETKNNSFESGKDDSTNSVSSVETNREKSTRDIGTTDVGKGFMNVSQSALLEAFRKTFLNIDEMIIRDLRENFMLIY